MIIRHIPVRSGKKSSFARLTQYITSKLGKHERLGLTQVNNCQSQTIDWAVEEIQATQALNQRAVSDKTYHLLISFPAGEAPYENILKYIEVAVCDALGFGEHQRISAVHHDTDNMHIHLAINKIHPLTHTMHDPYLAYKTLGKTAEKLEQQFGLQKTNHTASKSLSENHANDLEHHTGIESMLSWIRTHCLENLQKAQNWSEFNHILAANSLSLQTRGNGLVITNDKGIFVKASTIARDLSKSKLETRFGKFIPQQNKNGFVKQSVKDKPRVAKPGINPPPRSKGRFVYLDQIEDISFSKNNRYTNKPIQTPVNTDALFKRYTREMADIKISRIKKLNDIKKQKMKAIIQIKSHAQRKRVAVKLLNEKYSKKILYNLISRTYKEELTKINASYRELRLAITTDNQQKTWIDWLKELAANKNTQALHALRSRAVKKPLTGNTVSGLNSDINVKAAEVNLDGITKSGTLIYRAGTVAIRDDGNTLKVSNTFTKMSLQTALDEAIKRYGNTLEVQGSESFKNEIIKMVITAYPNIRFSDVSLETKRQQKLHQNNQLKGQKNAVNRREFKSRRTAGGSIKGNWGASDGRGCNRNSTNIFNKPNIERPGRKPPPESQNRLRTMSELGMVQFTNRSEVLLQGDVSSNLEHQRSKSNNGLRWDVSGAGIKGQFAAEKYIAERESKRLKGIDIFKHKLAHKDQVGIYKFAGMRIIDGQHLILLKSTDEILVYPSDEKNVSRFIKLSIGDNIELTNKGITLKRTRRF